MPTARLFFGALRHPDANGGLWITIFQPPEETTAPTDTTPGNYLVPFGGQGEQPGQLVLGPGVAFQFNNPPQPEIQIHQEWANPVIVSFPNPNPLYLSVVPLNNEAQAAICTGNLTYQIGAAVQLYNLVSFDNCILVANRTRLLCYASGFGPDGSARAGLLDLSFPMNTMQATGYFYHLGWEPLPPLMVVQGGGEIALNANNCHISIQLAHQCRECSQLKGRTTFSGTQWKSKTKGKGSCHGCVLQRSAQQ